MATPKETAIAQLEELYEKLGRAPDTSGTLTDLNQRIREATAELDALHDDGSEGNEAEHQEAVERLTMLYEQLNREADTSGTLDELNQRIAAAEAEIEALNKDEAGSNENGETGTNKTPAEDAATAAIEPNAPPADKSTNAGFHRLEELAKRIDEDLDEPALKSAQGAYATVKMLKTMHIQAFESGGIKNVIAVKGTTHQVKSATANALQGEGNVIII